MRAGAHPVDQVERALPKVGLTPEAATRRIRAMRHGFGAAATVRGFERLIDQMTCDGKDRHVLAATVAGGASTLMTFNVKDFPERSTSGYGIEVVHPDAFLSRLLSGDSERALAALESAVARLRRPPMAIGDFLSSLTSVVPSFAREAADAAATARAPTS